MLLVAVTTWAQTLPATDKAFTVVAEGHSTGAKPGWAINNEGTGNASSLDGHGASYYATAAELRKLQGTDTIITMYPTQFDNNGEYSFESLYPGAQYDMYPQLGPDTTLLQLGQARAAMFVISSTTENKIKCLGDVPTVAIQLAVRVIQK